MADILKIVILAQVLVRLIFKSLGIQRATSFDRHRLNFKANDTQLFTICDLVGLDSHRKVIVEYDRPIIHLLSDLNPFLEVVLQLQLLCFWVLNELLSRAR